MRRGVALPGRVWCTNDRGPPGWPHRGKQFGPRPEPGITSGWGSAPAPTTVVNGVRCPRPWARWSSRGGGMNPGQAPQVYGRVSGVPIFHAWPGNPSARTWSFRGFRAPATGVCPASPGASTRLQRGRFSPNRWTSPRRAAPMFRPLGGSGQDTPPVPGFRPGPVAARPSPPARRFGRRPELLHRCFDET